MNTKRTALSESDMHVGTPFYLVSKFEKTAVSFWWTLEEFVKSCCGLRGASQAHTIFHHGSFRSKV